MNSGAARVFDSACGPIAVSTYDGWLCVELLDTGGPAPYDFPEFFLAESWPEIHERVRVRRVMADLAERGRWLVEREWDDLDELGIGKAVSRVMRDVLPTRAADRARAGLVIGRLRRAGHVVEFRHGAARCEPDPPPELAAAFGELQPFLCDLLTEEASDGGGRGESV